MPSSCSLLLKGEPGGTQRNDHMSTAVTIVHHTMYVFAYVLATSKHRDREGGSEQGTKGEGKNENNC